MADTKEQHILDIQVSYDQAVQGIMKYKKEIEALKTKLSDLNDAYAAGTITEGEYTKETELTRAAINEYNRDVRSLRKEIQNNQRIEKEALGSLQQKRAELSNLTKRYDQLSEAERKNGAEGKKLAAQIKQLTQEIKGAEADTERFYRNVGNYTNSIMAAITGNSKFAQSIMGMTQGGEGFKGMMQGMIGSVKSFGAALMGLAANPVVLAIAGIAGAGAAFKWFYDYNQGIAEATRLTKEFMGIEGDALVSARNSIQATADTFGKDYKEVLSTVDALMAQYGISAEEAIKVVNDGFVAGADLSGDMLSKLQQYAPTFHDAGVSASEMTAILAQTRSGIFSDKGMDIITMASKRIREMSTATAASLDAIGISSQKVSQDLANGTKSTFDAIQEIATRMKSFGADSQEVGAVLKDVFGRQGADAGIQLIEQLDTMTTKIEDVKAVTGEYGQMQEEQLKASEELNNAMSTLFDMSGKGWEVMTMQIKVIATKWLAAAIRGIVVFINRCIDLYNNSLLFRSAIQALIFGFKNLWSVVSGAFNLIITGAKSVGRSLEGIAYILEGILTLSLDKAKEGFRLLVSNVGKTITEGRGDIRKAGANMAQNLVDGWNNTINNTPIAHLSADGGVASGTGGGMAALPLPSGGGAATSSSGGKGGKSGGKSSGADAAAKAAAERAKVEREEIAKAEELLTKLITDNTERRRAEINASYDKQIADIKAKLADKAKLTEAAEKALNSQLESLESLRERDLAKLSEDAVKADVERVNKRIALLLAAARKGSEEEMELKMQQLDNQQRIEEASLIASVTNATEREEMLLALRKSYAEKRLQVERDHTKAVQAEQDKLIGNEWQEKLNAAFGNELAIAQINAQRSLEALQAAQQMEGETIDDFNARKLQLEAQYQQDKQALTEKEIEVEKAKYDAMASMVGGLQQVTEAFGESSKGMAKMSKVLALAEIAINSGAAIAAGVKQAQSVPYPANLAAIATTVATILANVASAIKTVKGAKFATGGYVRGAGSATSDSIPARLSNGESVIAAAPTAMFAPILSALNQLGGGAPIIVQSPQQQIGEDFLAAAVAKGMAIAPRPIVSVEEINDVGRRVDVIENLGTL